MSTIWTTGWEALPANLSSPSLGPAYIRGLKTAIHERMWNEHGTYSNANSGADGSPGKDWVHKAGSAVAYFVTSTPTKRPDASTAFTTSDTGRFWVNSTTRQLRILSGTGFTRVLGEDSKYFVMSIGYWNFVNNSSIDKIIYFSLYPFLSQVSFVSAKAIIQSDAGNGWWAYPLPSAVFSTGIGMIQIYKYTPLKLYDLTLYRPTRKNQNGFQTATNRGWIVIEYV